MLDEDKDFVGPAAKEMMEETGILIHQDSLVDLTEMAFQKNQEYKGVYPSAGGCDEFIRLFLFRRIVGRKALDVLAQRLGGADEHEMIKLRLVPYETLWRDAPDAKALSAICLYEKLSANGELADSWVNVGDDEIVNPQLSKEKLKAKAEKKKGKA